MFGRSVFSSTKNFNPVLKSLNKNVYLNATKTVPSQIVVSSQQRPTINNANYSTQSKPFTMNVKNESDLRKPKQPTSPHVLIYRFPLPAVMSIMHRVTGVALGLGLGGICAAAVFAPQDVSVYIDLIKTQYPLLVYPIKFCIAFPLTYHFCTGVRHLIWDETHKGITTASAESTCKIILGVVGVATLFFTFFSFSS